MGKNFAIRTSAITAVAVAIQIDDVSEYASMPEPVDTRSTTHDTGVYANTIANANTAISKPGRYSGDLTI
jgi:hypothetical protein